eukprot:938515-Ditylum_brightwellii.AAC.1
MSQARTAGGLGPRWGPLAAGQCRLHVVALTARTNMQVRPSRLRYTTRCAYNSPDHEHVTASSM